MLTNHNVVVAIADSGGEGSPEREFLRRVKAIEPRVVAHDAAARRADSRMLASAVADGTAQKFFVAGRDDQPLRERYESSSDEGPPPPPWGPDAQGRVGTEAAAAAKELTLEAAPLTAESA